MQKVVVTGYLGKTPELKETHSGSRIANFSLGSNEWSKPGEEKKTEWFNVTCFGKTAEAMGQVGKGAHVMVDGRLETTKYTKKDGTEAYSTKLLANTVALVLETKKDKNPDLPPSDFSDIAF